MKKDKTLLMTVLFGGALSLQAAVVPVGVWAGTSGDGDHVITNETGSAFTLLFHDDSDGNGAVGLRTEFASPVTLDAVTNTTLLMSLKIKDIVTSYGANNQLRLGFRNDDTGSLNDATMHYVFGYGDPGNRYDTRYAGNSFSSGEYSYGAAFDAVTLSSANAIYTGNECSIRIALTYLGEVGDGTNHNYRAAIRWDGQKQTSVTAFTRNTATWDSAYLVFNNAAIQVEGDGFTATNIEVSVGAEPLDLGLFTQLGSDPDTTWSNLGDGGGTITYGTNTTRSDAGIQAAVDVALENVGDKLIYTCTYGNIVNNIDANNMFRSGFQFGISNCIHFTTGYGTSTDGRFYKNVGSNPFSGGSVVGVSNPGFMSDPALRFDDGNTIDATFTVELRSVSPGSNDFLVAVQYVNGTVTNSMSQEITGIGDTTINRLYHLGNSSLLEYEGDTWTVSNAAIAFEAAPVFANPYEVWAYIFGLESGNAAMGSDPDGDGMLNIGEYAFGGDPTDDTDQGVAPVLVSDGGLKYVYRIVADTNVSHAVVTQTNLLVAGGSINVIPVSTNLVGGYNVYSNTVDTSVEDKGFLKLELTY